MRSETALVSPCTTILLRSPPSRQQSNSSSFNFHRSREAHVRALFVKPAELFVNEIEIDRALPVLPHCLEGLNDLLVLSIPRRVIRRFTFNCGWAGLLRSCRPSGLWHMN